MSVQIAAQTVWVHRYSNFYFHVMKRLKQRHLLFNFTSIYHFYWLKRRLSLWWKQNFLQHNINNQKRLKWLWSKVDWNVLDTVLQTMSGFCSKACRFDTEPFMTPGSNEHLYCAKIQRKSLSRLHKHNKKLLLRHILLHSSSFFSLTGGAWRILQCFEAGMKSSVFFHGCAKERRKETC